MRNFWALTRVMLLGTVRDRLFHAVFGIALLMLALVPVFSIFSMRQSQELAITLSLSAISFTLVIFSVLMGSASLWRDIEKRYTASVLGLPVPRPAFVLSKFAGIAIFLTCCGLGLALVSAAIIKVVGWQYPADRTILWGNILIAIGAEILKYTLLAAVALFFSAVSTSFFLPIFGTIGVFFAGSASQEVMEYVSGEFGRQIAPLSREIIQAVYYLIPNLSSLDFKVEAIYSLPIAPTGVLLAVLYSLVYTTLLLFGAIWIFSRRELP